MHAAAALAKADLGGRNLEIAVHITEVDGVVVVLVHVLHVHGHLEQQAARGGPVRMRELGDLVHLPVGRLALGVVPHEDELVALGHLPAAHARERRNLLAVGDLDAAAGSVVLPRVERAGEILADHAPALREVRAQMRAIGVEHARLPGARAEENQLLAEVADAPDLAG